MAEDLISSIFTNPLFWVLIIVVAILYFWSKKKSDSPYKKAGWGKAFISQLTEREIKKIIKTLGKKSGGGQTTNNLLSFGMIILCWFAFYLYMHIALFFLAINMTILMAIVSYVFKGKTQKLTWNSIELGDIDHYFREKIKYNVRIKNPSPDKKKKWIMSEKEAELYLFMLKSKNIILKAFGLGQKIFVIKADDVTTDAYTFNINGEYSILPFGNIFILDEEEEKEFITSNIWRMLLEENLGHLEDYNRKMAYQQPGTTASIEKIEKLSEAIQKQKSMRTVED